MKLLTKLTLYTTLSKILIVLLFIWILPGLVKDVVTSYTNANLREQQKKVLADITKNGIDYYLDGDSGYGSYTMLKEEFISLEPFTKVGLTDTIQTALRIVEDDTLTYRLLNHVFIYDHKKYLLEIGKTISAINQYDRPLQKVALYVLIALVGLTLIIDLGYTRLVLRPLNRIIRSRLSNQQFPFAAEMIPVKTGTSDFRYLDASLIGLMHKIKEAFDKEREFTSNASHELMTPIGILQNKLENLMLDNGMNDDDQEKIAGMMITLNRLTKIVRSLLMISRIENDQYLLKDTMNLSLLLEDIRKELEDRLQARSITCTIQLSAHIMLRQINRDLLFQLFYNIINNAIRYNKDGGSITIDDQTSADGSYTLHINDSGIGIPEGELSSIFNRFKKTTGSVGEGFGLGLSIVKSIADFHGMTISVNSEYGSRTDFSIQFPSVLVTMNQ